MAKINFYTQSKQEGQPATIYLRFSDGRKTDIWTPTPEKIFPEYWSNKGQSFKQRIFFNKEFTEKNKIDIEARFSQLKDFILKEHFELAGNPVTKEWLISVIHRFYNKQTLKDEPLNEYIKRFIEEATSGARLCNNGTTKKVYTYGTLRSLRGLQLSFNKFQGIEEEEEEGKKKRKQKPEKWPKQLYKPLNYNDITIDFYNDFVQFFYSRNCGANYIGKHIKSLKTIMRQAREEGLHNNMEIERKSFKAISEPVENIYLNEAELKSIFELDLSDNPLLQVARDVFLTGCYLAQRYSDYSKIRISNIRTIEGKKVIDLIQQKTGERVVIPIRHELEIILKRYDYTLPKTFEQKINDRIKDIGKLAGITEVINYEENRGGLRVKKSVKKYQLIKTHTARRSGCTNLYLAGIPLIDIMKLSGHKTPKEFLKYIKTGKDETALNLASHPYFIGNTLSVAK
ncbi:MAG: tyrosine-type recombinase/integrase [Bacteroidales bacterium]|nr:tyrosine-type recombinase/integrase [Bacteroidales bacterium]